jgi:hypothetical protein
MPLHHLTKKAAIEKYGQITDPEQLKAELEKDEKKFTTDQVIEIMDAIIYEQGASGNPLKAPELPKEQTQGEKLGLGRFDYDNLLDEDFKAYNEIVNKLNLQEQYDFELHKIQVQKVDKYPDLPNSPKILRGITKESSRPINTTRIEVKRALELNRQAENSKFYYFLKK